MFPHDFFLFQKPDRKVQDEDYLLGKSIEKNYGQSERNEQDVIPAVARRVVGSSMLTSSGDGQVDLARKIREDPLLLVKERERAARAALLNNPLQRRRLADLLRKEQVKNYCYNIKLNGHLLFYLVVNLTVLSVWGHSTTVGCGIIDLI